MSPATGGSEKGGAHVGGGGSRETARPSEEKAPKSKEINVDEAIKSVIDHSVQKDVLPKGSDIWEDSQRPGNSLMKIDDSQEFVIGQKTLTGKELKEKYGVKGIMYKGNEPDFSPFVDPVLGAVDVSHMPTERTGKEGTYSIACQDVIERSDGRFKTKKDVETYMKENRLTWHETADRKHILPIPTSINAGFKHTGGISKQKSIEAMSEVLYDKYGGKLKVSKESLTGEVSGDIGGIIPAYAQKKKENARKKK